MRRLSATSDASNARADLGDIQRAYSLCGQQIEALQGMRTQTARNAYLAWLRSELIRAARAVA
jgi:hypothetical protein